MTSSFLLLTITDEVRELAATLAFSDLASRGEINQRVNRLGEVLTKLSGVVSLPDFCKHYWGSKPKGPAHSKLSHVNFVL